MDSLFLVGNEKTLIPDRLRSLQRTLTARNLTHNGTLVVFGTREPPTGLSGGLTHFAVQDFIHATMTYSPEAQIYFPYGYVLPKSRGESPFYENISGSSGKTFIN